MQNKLDPYEVLECVLENASDKYYKSGYALDYTALIMQSLEQMGFGIRPIPTPARTVFNK